MPASGRNVRRTALRNHDRAAAELKLRSVGANSQSNLKAKGFLEPFHGGGNVRIFDDRNDRGRRHGTVHPHHVS
jgi:hypothetical protein